MYCVLSKSFRFAVTKYKFLKHNNMKYVDVDYEFKKVKRDIPSKEMVYEALSLLSREYRHSYFIPVAIAYHTGMRRSEILALSFDKNVVDLDKQVIYVKKQARFIDGEIHLVDLKTEASEMEILISGELTRILKEHKKFLEKNDIKDNFVCRNHNLEVMNSECVSHILRLLKNKFGLKIRLDDLRHLHGSLLCEVGCNYKGIQQRLGHSNLSTTMNIYVKTIKELKKNTAKMWEDVL